MRKLARPGCSLRLLASDASDQRSLPLPRRLTCQGRDSSLRPASDQAMNTKQLARPIRYTGTTTADSMTDNIDGSDEYLDIWPILWGSARREVERNICMFLCLIMTLWLLLISYSGTRRRETCDRQEDCSRSQTVSLCSQSACNVHCITSE